MSRQGLKRAESRYAQELGEWIRSSRVELGLSLDEFAAEMDVHRNTIWRWESGNSMPNPFRLRQIQELAKTVAVAK